MFSSLSVFSVRFLVPFLVPRVETVFVFVRLRFVFLAAVSLFAFFVVFAVLDALRPVLFF